MQNSLAGPQRPLLGSPDQSTPNLSSPQGCRTRQGWPQSARATDQLSSCNKSEGQKCLTRLTGMNKNVEDSISNLLLHVEGVHLIKDYFFRCFFNLI